MADPQVLGALAQGLQSGLMAYNQEDQRRFEREEKKKDRAYKQQEFQLKAAEHDLQPDETGRLVQSERGKLKEALGASKTELESARKYATDFGGRAAVEAYQKAQQRNDDLMNRIYGVSGGAVAPSPEVLPEQQASPSTAQPGLLPGQGLMPEVAPGQPAAPKMEGIGYGGTRGVNMGAPEGQGRRPISAPPNAMQMPGRPISAAPEGTQPLALAEGSTDEMQYQPAKRRMQQATFEATQAQRAASNAYKQSTEEGRKLARQTHNEERLDKLRKNLKDDIDPDRNRAGNFGKISQRYLQAQNLNTLARESNGNILNLAPQFQAELAEGMANMITSGTGSSEARVKALVPQSMVGDTQKLKGWLFNEPLGANQQAFTKLMLESIDREANQAQKQMSDIMKRRLSAHSELKKTDPEGYQAILQSYGFDKLGERGVTPLAGSKEGLIPKRQVTGNAVTDEDWQAIEWAKANKNDPRAVKILQLHGLK